MKITSGKREDILRRKAEYDAKVADYDARNEAARQKMRDDEYAAVAPLKEKLESDLAMWDTLGFEVRVERDWGLGSDNAKGDTLEVNISCNEHNKFNDNVALSWSYDVKLRRGEVQAETSSWSGMKATTKEQLESLRETLYALEYLNRLDWKKLLATTLPDVMSYYKDVGERPKKDEDFDAELIQAEIEDLIGTNKIIRVKPWESAPYRGDMYLKILSETASQYKVIVIPAYTVESGRAEQFLAEHTYENRIRKSSVRPVQPLDIVEV